MSQQSFDVCRHSRWVHLRVVGGYWPNPKPTPPGFVKLKGQSEGGVYSFVACLSILIFDHTSGTAGGGGGGGYHEQSPRFEPPGVALGAVYKRSTFRQINVDNLNTTKMRMGSHGAIKYASRCCQRLVFYYYCCVPGS